MNYVLPVTINNRRKYDLLFSGDEDKDTESFIAELPQRPGGFKLLHINLNEVIKGLNVGMTDVLLSKCGIELNYNNLKCELNIIITSGASPAPAGNNKADSGSNYRVPWEDSIGKTPAMENMAAPVNKQEITIDNNIQFTAIKTLGNEFIIDGEMRRLQQFNGSVQKILFRFVLNAGKSYCGNFEVYLAHPLQLRSCGLDFGSEASQLKTKRKRDDGGNQIVENNGDISLFRRMRSLLEDIPRAREGKEVEDREFLQHEADTTFYKSIFFLKKNITGYDEYMATLPDEKENLKLLTLLTELAATRANYHQLPNLKLAHKYAADLHWLTFSDADKVPIPFGDLKDKAYVTILKNIIKAWLRSERILSRSGHLARIVLLVPNIYSLDDVVRVKKALDTIINEINEDAIKSSQHPLAGWEIMTVSESDASFLGFFNTLQYPIEKDKYYIVIDCGKGTTDFSILKSGQHNELEIEPCYRNGFAGAGNLITYAFFKTVLAELLDRAADGMTKPDFKKLFDNLRPKIGEAAVLLFYEFYLLIERHKKNTGDRDCLPTWNSVRWAGGSKGFADILLDAGATLTNVNELLKEVSGIADRFGLIREAREEIVNKVIENLEIAVRELNKTQRCGGVLISGRGFLYKPLKNLMITKISERLRIDRNLVVSPEDDSELKSVCLQGIFKPFFVYNPNMVGIPLQLKTRQAPLPQDTERRVASGVRGFFRKYFVNEEEIENTYAADMSILSKDEITVDANSKNFLIGNQIYQFADFVGNSAVKVSIVFTGKVFKARKMNGLTVERISDLEVNEVLREKRQNYGPSLFPEWINWDLLSDVPEKVDEMRNKF